MKLKLLTAVAMTALLAACADSPDVASPDSPNLFVIDSETRSTDVILCKASFFEVPLNGGVDDGTLLLPPFDFLVSDDDDGTDWVVDATPSVQAKPWADIAPSNTVSDIRDECELVWSRPMASYDDETVITIEEIVPEYAGLRRRVAYHRVQGATIPELTDEGLLPIPNDTDLLISPPDPPLTDGTYGISFVPYGLTIVYFKNVKLDDPPTGGEGCTPGFWQNLRQRAGDWTDAGYAPTDDLEATFGLVAGTLDGTEAEDWTLYDAITQNGNGNTVGQLLRHATAALLNAGSPGVAYPYTEAQIIAMVQDVLDDAEPDYESLKDMFDEANNAGAPLCD